MAFTVHPRHSLKTRILLATLALFIVAIWSLSIFAGRVLRDDIEHLLGEQQRTTVAYIAGEIEREIGSRIKALETVAGEIDPDLLADHARLQARIEQFVLLRRIFNTGFWITDEAGTTVADVPRSTGRIGVDYRDREYIRKTLENNRPTVAHPLQGRVLDTTVIVTAVPLRGEQGEVIGIICGGTRLDQPNFLDPITENQYGRTGGFALISPEQRLIIVATDKTRNMERLPPRGVNPDTDRSIDGHRGTQIQKDARGVEILVSTHSVPSAAWYVAATLPTEEAFAPINDIRKNILAATLLLTLLTAAIMGWLLRRQLHPLEATARTLADMGKEGTSVAPLPLNRTDEIGQLIAAFNDLLARLRKRERALAESEARFKALHDGSSGGIAIHDRGVILDCNPSLSEMTGYSHAELVGMDGLRLIAPDWQAHVMQNILNGFDSPYEVRGRRKNGEIYPLLIRGKSIPYRERQVRVTEFRDITKEKLAEQQQRIAAIAFESREGLFITDADFRIVRANLTFLEIFGYALDEVIGTEPRFLCSTRHGEEFFSSLRKTLDNDGAWQGEVWSRRKNGEEFPSWGTLTAVRDSTGNTTHYVASIDDITERKMAEEEIRHLAFFDQLTGLPNRRLLADRLKQALAASCRHGYCGALLFIDLDNFKTLNDTLGHDQGDVLLQQVAQRLKSCIREGDTLARLGGDEFVVMLETLGDSAREAAAHAETVGEKIITSLGQPYRFPGYEHHSSASIGIALFLGCDEVAEDILKRADMAMYQAKSAGRNTLRFFDPEMQSIISARAALEAGLREAVQNRSFALHYQPQVDSAHRITGAEALLRWIDPRYSKIPVSSFIAAAEDTGLIIPIGDWVLSTVCQQLAKWSTEPALAHLRISVNISSRQFQQKNFVERLLATITRHGANPQRLQIELTESILIHDIDDVVTKMSALKASGIRCSLDDFGTGYSSLSYLKRLPLDQLKIDQGFVRDILDDPDDAMIASMIVSLGENFGLNVIAEGVETEEQLLKLAERGCNHYQGYLFSRPLPAEAFEDYIRQ